MEPTKTPRVLSGRYELSHLVARGGMAEVYRAHDQLLDRPVALKVLFPELSVDRSFVERFRREAQAAANLSDPHIVPVFDWGEDGGTYFIVMEFVDGRALSSILRTAGPLHPDRAAEIGADVALALSYAHRHGVVHRDVKPGNVLITEEGTIKVTDFGIARAVNTEESLTQTGAVMGTATYFSPEQAEGMGVDATSDIYSLGVVIFEMVTGRPPFLGDTPVAVASKHVREHPPRPREINPGVPPDLEAIILKCLAKTPDHRYASGEELAKDLQYFREGRAVRAASPATGQHPVVGATQAVGAVTGRTQTLAPVGTDGFAPGEPPSRTRLYAGILAVLLVALAVVLIFLGNSLGWWHLGTTAPVTVPNVAGQSVSKAEHTLRSKGLHVRTVPDLTATKVPKTTVIRTQPAGGSTVNQGQTVTIVTGNQGPPVHVPNVVNNSVQAAKAQLTGLGLKPVVQTSRSCTQQLIVCQQSPTGGTLAPGSTVVITTAPTTSAVPSVNGLDETTACNSLDQAGFQCGAVTKQASQSVGAGAVITTNPAPGAQEPPNTIINLVVSSGPSQVTIPYVIGKSTSAAITALQNANLTNIVQSCQPTQDPTQDNVVVNQTPPPGTQVPPSQQITITFGSLSGCGSSSSSTSTTNAGGNTGNTGNTGTGHHGPRR